ncbi:retrovirus-related Pol polyprotein from transposon 297 [Caerostris extrusa]|uniref:Retrovirus-related Pol polyprotein from transposon 297 n=1 Tax=Caerostris extrusa TaxID=172846 RepID=A0AAV4XIH0_CAEEX|nr:retrovirus-related Pol polyprotein from transposon 297 [Caerostris extrusa]
MANKNEKGQTHHVNLLKPYHKRHERVNLAITKREEIFGNGSEDVEIKYPSFDANVFNFEEIVSESDLENRLSVQEIDEMRKLLIIKGFSLVSQEKQI